MLMGLGTQAVLCFITDSCPFHCGKIQMFYNHITLLAKFIYTEEQNEGSFSLGKY